MEITTPWRSVDWISDRNITINVCEICFFSFASYFFKIIGALSNTTTQSRSVIKINPPLDVLISDEKFPVSRWGESAIQIFFKEQDKPLEGLIFKLKNNCKVNMQFSLLIKTDWITTNQEKHKLGKYFDWLE